MLADILLSQIYSVELVVSPHPLKSLAKSKYRYLLLEMVMEVYLCSIVPYVPLKGNRSIPVVFIKEGW